jgi:hypothetical protein
MANEPKIDFSQYRKLNYGCGYDKREGYLNVDMDPHCAPDFLVQNMDFSQIPKHRFDEVTAAGAAQLRFFRRAWAAFSNSLVSSGQD